MWDYKNNMIDYGKVCGLLLISVFLISISAEASVRNTGVYPENSFIDPSAMIDVDSFSIGSESYIAPFSEFSGKSVSIGSYSDVQDSVTGSGNIIIADKAVVAHGAELTGNVEIGSDAFIGFNSKITDSKIGEGAYINIGSNITGVDIPPHKSVPAGSVIDSQDDIEKLKPVTIAQKVFVEDVIEVNIALAKGYTDLYGKKGSEAFGKVGPYGYREIMMDGKYVLGYSDTSEPAIGKGTGIDRARIIGNVNLGENTKVEDGTAIRADEGVPIIIGDSARIGKNNTFHSLNNKVIEIGKDFNLGSDTVIHGPLSLGNNVKVGNRAVVFKSKIGNNVLIGDNAIVTGVRLLDGVIIPPNAVINKQQIANNFNNKVKKDTQTEPAWIFRFLGGLFS